MCIPLVWQKLTTKYKLFANHLNVRRKFLFLANLQVQFLLSVGFLLRLFINYTKHGLCTSTRHVFMFLICIILSIYLYLPTCDLSI